MGMFWKLKVEQRERTFIWLLIHEKLLANYNKWRRLMAESPRYELGQELEVTNLHAIRNCTVAKRGRGK